MTTRIFTLLVALSLPAFASEPSDACREGAAYCHAAWEQLEACEQRNAGPCEAEEAEALRQCAETNAACHTDGSRAKP